MASVAAQTLVTPEEYLVFERKAEFKSEFFNGEIIEMPGASNAHNLITVNTINGIYNQVVEQGCRVYGSDMRVGTSPVTSYLYPDVTVVCDEPHFEDDVFDTLINPLVLVEVLSPSTEARDRGEKFAYYRQLESVQEYILISQDRVRVEHYLRQGEKWVFEELREFTDVLRIVSIACELPLQHIYRLVEFA